MLQYNGHLPVYVLLRKWTEALGRVSRERKTHFKLSWIVGVAIFHSAAQVAPGHHRRSTQHIPGLAHVWRTGSRARFRPPRHQLGIRWQNAAVFSQRLGLRR